MVSEVRAFVASAPQRIQDTGIQGYQLPRKHYRQCKRTRCAAKALASTQTTTRTRPSRRYSSMRVRTFEVDTSPGGVGIQVGTATHRDVRTHPRTCRLTADLHDALTAVETQ